MALSYDNAILQIQRRSPFTVKFKLKLNVFVYTHADYSHIAHRTSHIDIVRISISISIRVFARLSLNLKRAGSSPSSASKNTH